MYLIFDTETTGLPKKWGAPISDTDNWPRCIQIAWQLHDDMGKLIEHQDYLVKPEGFNIPYDAERIHGISTELAEADGISLGEVLEKFNIALSQSNYIVGHNLSFILNVMECEFFRYGFSANLEAKLLLDTCTGPTVELMKLPSDINGNYKFPKLSELYKYLFNEIITDRYDAVIDVEIISKCFFELIRRNVFSNIELVPNLNDSENFQEIKTKKIEHIEIGQNDFQSLSDEKVVLEIFKRNPLLFRNLISGYYPLKHELIEKYKDELNWLILSSNKNLSWSDELIEKYKDKWKYISGRIFLPWSLEFIEKYQDEWDWKELSRNKSIFWTNELIEKFENKWYWGALAENESLLLTEELIEKYKDKWNWEALSKRESLPWSEKFVEKYKESLQFYYLSENKSLPWSEEFIEKYKWNWEFLSSNENLPWSNVFFEKYIDKWDFSHLSQNENLPWTEELIEKYWTKWSWCSLSANKSVPWSNELIKRYKQWNWKLLSENKSLPWSIELVANFKDRWNWPALSRNENLPWSNEFFSKFKDKLNFEELSKNIALPWSKELILMINNNVKWFGLDWKNLSSNSSLSLDEKFIETFKNELDWFSLNEIQNLPYSIKFIYKYSEGLYANESIWNLLKEYLNDDLIKSIFDDPNWKNAKIQWQPKSFTRYLGSSPF